MNEVLFRKLQKLQEEVHYLESNKIKFLNELNTSIEAKKIVERSVYLCSEMVLDIADTLIAVKNLPKADTYNDSIYKLGDYKVIPKPFAHKFVYIAGLRNFLAHDYQVNTINSLKRFLKTGLKDVKKYISFIEKQ